MITEAIPLLEAVEISKHFDGICALDRVSFQLKRGEILGLIGANGSGKTTLLNILSRLIDHDGGVIFFENEPYNELSPEALASRGIGRSFQHTHNWKRMSVKDNVLLTGREWWRENIWYSFLNRKKIALIEQSILNRAVTLFDYFEIDTRTSIDIREAGELSLGEQRILELIRLFIFEPIVLLLDEPSVDLNPRLCNLLGGYLDQLATGGRSILLISHNLNFLKKNATRLIAMNQGKIVAEGKVDDVLRNEKVLEAYLGTT